MNDEQYCICVDQLRLSFNWLEVVIRADTQGMAATKAYLDSYYADLKAGVQRDELPRDYPWWQEGQTQLCTFTQFNASIDDNQWWDALDDAAAAVQCWVSVDPEDMNRILLHKMIDSAYVNTWMREAYLKHFPI